MNEQIFMFWFGGGLLSLTLSGALFVMDDDWRWFLVPVMWFCLAGLVEP